MPPVYACFQAVFFFVVKIFAEAFLVCGLVDPAHAVIGVGNGSTVCVGGAGDVFRVVVGKGIAFHAPSDVWTATILPQPSRLNAIRFPRPLSTL